MVMKSGGHIVAQVHEEVTARKVENKYVVLGQVSDNLTCIFIHS